MPNQEDYCRLAACYNEATTRPLSCDDELPPPQYYHQSHSRYSSASKSRQREQAKMNLPTAVLSLVKPHKIISISTKMCEYFGFGEERHVSHILLETECLRDASSSCFLRAAAS